MNIRTLALPLVGLVVVVTTSSLPAQTGPANVVVEPVGTGVYAAIRQEPLGHAVNGNSLFIVNDDDVVIVDAQFTRAATLENLAALRRITSKPVSLVINTHWHDDHLAGNQVYQDSFPGVRFLATAATRADLIALGRPNRDGTHEHAPAIADRFQRLLDMGLGIDSLPASPLEKQTVTSALRIIRQYFAERPGYREVLPDTLTGNHMRITRGNRVIDLHWFGRGNTRGDLVVHLPQEGVVATGDLLVAPVPFGFNSYPTEWLAVLDSVAALQPRALVPGHGAVMHDLEYLRTVQQMLRAAQTETRAALARGLEADAIQREVMLDTFRERMAGEEKWLNTLFRQFFKVPVVARYIEEAKAGGLK